MLLLESNGQVPTITPGYDYLHLLLDPGAWAGVNWTVTALSHLTQASHSPDSHLALAACGNAYN